MSTDPGDTPTRTAGTSNLLHVIGRRVRSARRAASMTQSQLAESSGVSKRMIALVENGTGNASLATLGKIADGLSLPFGRLASDVQSPFSDRVIHATRVDAIYRSSTGSYGTLLLAANQPGPAELWDWFLMPGDVYHAEPDPLGSEELIQVRFGTLIVSIRDKDYRLDADDALRIESDRKYSFATSGPSPVRFVRVVTPARA